MKEVQQMTKMIDEIWTKQNIQSALTTMANFNIIHKYNTKVVCETLKHEALEVKELQPITMLMDEIWAEENTRPILTIVKGIKKNEDFLRVMKTSINVTNIKDET